MSQLLLTLKDVSFGYHSLPESLFKNLTLDFPRGWTGVIGINGCGKTTLLKLLTGEIEPDAGKINYPEHRIYCEQRTDHPPRYFKRFLDEDTKEIRQLKGHFNIVQDWDTRWETLSHGERKVAQIAVALWRQPDVLAIDEPTNHLDTDMTGLVIKRLIGFKGIGILVSHNRALLDDLCHQCLFIEPQGVCVIAGGVTKGLMQINHGKMYTKKQYDLKKKACKKISREIVKRSQLAQSAKKRISKKGISSKDHDSKSKINLAKLTGKDAVGGKLKRQLKGRLSKARIELGGIRVEKDPISGIWIDTAEMPRHIIARINSDRYAIGDHKRVCHSDLTISSGDRISVTGPNGSGKSTLIKKMVSLIHLPSHQVAYIPQEIGADDSKDVLRSVLDLPKETRSYLMMIISRLGSHPRRLLDSRLPSPGEMRKLMLALGIVHAPHIIIMDEPTNHMDLASILSMEKALENCRCSLVLVSHDHDFLSKLTTIRWHFDLKKSQPPEYEIICDLIS